jgi:hypothetical protein
MTLDAEAFAMPPRHAIWLFAGSGILRDEKSASKKKQLGTIHKLAVGMVN